MKILTYALIGVAGAFVGIYIYKKHKGSCDCAKTAAATSGGATAATPPSAAQVKPSAPVDSTTATQAGTVSADGFVKQPKTW